MNDSEIILVVAKVIMNNRNDFLFSGNNAEGIPNSKCSLISDFNL